MSEAQRQSYNFRLYVAGQTPKSIAAIANLKRLCDQHLAGRYEIHVVDLMKNPALAQRDQTPDDSRRALQLLRQAHRMGAPEPPVQYAMGLAYLAQARFQEAIGALEAALQGQPGDDQTLFHLGEAYRRATWPRRCRRDTRARRFRRSLHRGEGDRRLFRSPAPMRSARASAAGHIVVRLRWPRQRSSGCPP